MKPPSVRVIPGETSRSRHDSTMLVGADLWCAYIILYNTYTFTRICRVFSKMVVPELELVRVETYGDLGIPHFRNPYVSLQLP